MLLSDIVPTEYLVGFAAFVTLDDAIVWQHTVVQSGSENRNHAIFAIKPCIEVLTEDGIFPLDHDGVFRHTNSIAHYRTQRRKKDKYYALCA